MNSLYLKISTIILFFTSCLNTSEIRLFTTRGTHVLENEKLCKLIRSEPEDVVKDLGWDDKLALKSDAPCIVEVVCNEEVQILEFIEPVRIEVSIIKESTKIIVGDKVKVQASLYDHLGRELEVGKFTVFDWASSDFFETENDSSAGEFGLCDTCYGQYHFRVIKPGKGQIDVHFGKLHGKIEINIES